MAGEISADRWRSVQRAYRVTGARFAELVTGVPDPDAMVTADWTVADTVAQVAMIAKMYTSLVRQDSESVLEARGREQAEKTTVDTGFRAERLGIKRFSRTRHRRAGEGVAH